MMGKINKNGQGHFKYQQRVVQVDFPSSSEPRQNVWKQDFCFTSMKQILNEQRDQLVLESKLIPEKVRSGFKLVGIP